MCPRSRWPISRASVWQSSRVTRTGTRIDNAGPAFVGSSSEEDSLARLLNGGVDYTLMDELVVQYIVNNYPKESATRLEIGSTPLLTRELFLAVRRSRPDAQSIVSRFNAQLRGMMADRTYHRLLHVNWIRADIDNDGRPEFVPANDRVGPSAPQHVYTLFSVPRRRPRSQRPSPGSIWAATFTPTGRACQKTIRSAIPIRPIRAGRPPASSRSGGESESPPLSGSSQHPGQRHEDDRTDEGDND